MIGDKLKELRIKRGLSLQAVGDYVGVGKATVRRWETGDIKNMRRDKIVKLAEVLKTTPAFIMEMEDTPQDKEFIINGDVNIIIEKAKENDTFRRLALYASKLDPDKMEAVKNVIEKM